VLPCSSAPGISHAPNGPVLEGCGHSGFPHVQRQSLTALSVHQAADRSQAPDCAALPQRSLIGARAFLSRNFRSQARCISRAGRQPTPALSSEAVTASASLRFACTIHSGVIVIQRLLSQNAVRGPDSRPCRRCCFPAGVSSIHWFADAPRGQLCRISPLASRQTSSVRDRYTCRSSRQAVRRTASRQGRRVHANRSIISAGHQHTTDSRGPCPISISLASRKDTAQGLSDNSPPPPLPCTA